MLKRKKDAKFVFELPTLKSALSRIEEHTYQGVKLTHLKQAKDSISANVCKMVEEISVCLHERYGVLTAHTDEERTEMEELVTKELKDGDELLHDACKALRTSVWLAFSDEPLMNDELHFQFSDQIAALNWIYDT